MRTALVAATLLATLVGCGPAPVPSVALSGATPSPAAPSATASPTDTPTPSPTPLSRDEGWRADIDALLEARERIHPDPWHGMARADWVTAADAVKARIPTLTDDEALTELVRLATMPGWGGREGHTGIFPFIPGSGTHAYPITMWQFPDGLVITRARAPYEAAVGSRIVAIEGRPIAEVLALTDPLAPRDNPSNLLAYGPLYLRVSELLAGVGVIDEPGPATFTLEDPSGATSDLVIEPILADDDVKWHGGQPIGLPAGTPLWLSRPTDTLWWEVLPDGETLYVQYNVVEAGIDPIVDEILAKVQEGDIERVVVDLRHNGGGNLTTYRHFLHTLEDPAIDRPGRLVLLIGRLTFSAAATFATELDRTTGAWFAGEDMGGSPNLYGDARSTDLVSSGQEIYIASRYHEISTPDDERITIEPELPVPYTWADYRAGRDPVLDAVLLEAVKGVQAGGYPAPVTDTLDLLVRGGTVVTAAGSRRADVTVRGGRITAVDPDLGSLADRAREVIDATGMLVLPGVVDAHTHTRVASEASPDRFFQDSVAAAFGGTTTFLSFNNPGTGSSPAAERSLATGLREWLAATNADSAVDIGLSLVVSGRMDDPLAELAATIDAGVSTSKAFMVFDFRLGDRALSDAMALMGARGGMLQVHCEDPVLLDTAVTEAVARGDIAPRFHASTRPPYVEAVATARALAFARAADAPVHVVHLSSAAALDELRRAKGAGVRVTAETCPHYLVLTDDRYLDPDPASCARYVISPPLRSAGDRDALWAGLADGSLDLVATDHVPDRLDTEKAEAAQGVPFDRISNGAPGIETLLTILYSEGVARGRITPERMVDLLSTTPARRFGLTTKGAIEVGRDGDLVIFDPAARRTIRAADLHHTSDYTPYEGLDVRGAVRDVFVRGQAVIRAGAFVGIRGAGHFVERGPPAN